jgi:hypothetical protein
MLPFPVGGINTIDVTVLFRDFIESNLPDGHPGASNFIPS